MANSHRHHYIPKFLIKNFVDDKGFLHVYNKENKRIVSNQSPKAVFFELNRNLIDIQGVKTDNLERAYADIDNLFAASLDRILRNKTVTPEDLTSILVLATTTKWRIPSKDNDFNKVKEEVGYDDLPIKITIKDENGEDHKDALEDIVKSEVFKESKRLILPFLPFYEEEKLMGSLFNSFINTNDNIISVIGDCPIIERTNDDIHVLEDFIFPLSNTDTFICKKGHKGKLTNALFHIHRDLAIFHLSQKYVACKDKAHLENLAKVYDQLEKDSKTHLIITHLFNCI